MKETDKFLIGIVIGAALLIVVSIVVVMSRPEPAYQTDNTAEATAHNYLLALQKSDYERAYGYLDPTINCYPNTLNQFTADLTRFNSFSSNEQSISLAVTKSTISNNQATITIQETTFYQGNLFDSSQYTNSFDMILTRVEDNWKIITSDRYWDYQWGRSGRCN